MTEEISNIENRPKELYEIPYYNSLPDKKVTIDLEGVIGEFLTYDIFDLDGTQPIEARHMKASGGTIGVNPCKDSLEIYKKEKVKFQLIHVVINAYGFKEINGVLHAKPYCISLKPSTKRDKVSYVDPRWVENIDLANIDAAPKHYQGFNPFKNAFGFFVMGEVPMNPKIESDMIGFVCRTFALATPFKANEVLTPHIPTISKNKRVQNEYDKYRRNWYFKEFKKNKPRKIWGCDSPIELFLLQAMDREGLNPELQTIICEDGTIVPSFHKLWENQKVRGKAKVITEADFYFQDLKIAVFCDSKQHHSSQAAIEKDKTIDEKLKNIGVSSLRISGVDIAKSPVKSAQQVLKIINDIV